MGIHTFIPTRREPTIICGILHDPVFYTIFCVKFLSESMGWLQNVNIKTVIHSPRLHQDKSNLSFLFCFKYLLILLTKAKWRNCYVFCNVPFSSGLMTCILPICYHKKKITAFFSLSISGAGWHMPMMPSMTMMPYMPAMSMYSPSMMYGGMYVPMYGGNLYGNMMGNPTGSTSVSTVNPTVG